MNLGGRLLITFGIASSICSLSAMAQPSDPDKISVTREQIEEIGHTLLKDEYPDQNAPGYALARGSFALMNGIGQLIKDNEINDLQKEIISPMQSVEAAWPDRESENGMKIADLYWACKDAATVLRISMSLLADDITDYFETLNELYDVKRTTCVLALIAENVNSDPDYLKNKSGTQ